MYRESLNYIECVKAIVFDMYACCDGILISIGKMDSRLRWNDSVAQEVPEQPSNSNMQINPGNRLKIRLPEAIVACK